MTRQHIFNIFRFRLSFIKEMWHYFGLLCRYNASIDTEKDKEKLRYLIARESHVFEKGLSLKNTRREFGRQKAMNLFEHLEKYVKTYGIKDDTTNYAVNILDSYVAHLEKEGTECANLREKVESLKKCIDFHHVDAGIMLVQGDNLREKAKGDFGTLLLSRHSIRYFSETPVKRDVLIKALELSRHTPSACNRQSWKTHVFLGDKAVSLIEWQGGAKGAEKHIRCAILVTTDLRAFFAHEPFQAYVDGGLYAMNLINALHYCGLGTLPLSCGYPSDKLDTLVSFGIPQNEVPIIIIAVGNIDKEVKIAISNRLPIDHTNIFHDNEN